ARLARLRRPPRQHRPQPLTGDQPMPSFDPVTFEVMKNEFLSLVEEMASTIKRTARSSAVREGGDYSTYVLDPNGKSVARGGLPTWYVPNAMPWVIKRYA